MDMQLRIVDIDEILNQYGENCRILHDILSGKGAKYSLTAMANEILSQEKCINNGKLVGYLQLLSKLLKHNRSASHPERDIGKSRRDVNNSMIDLKEIINIGVINMQKLLYIIETVANDCREQCMTEYKVPAEDQTKSSILLSRIFFIYSFVLDVLKECNLPQKKHLLCESQDDTNIVLVNVIVEHFAKLNIEYVVNYSPICHKLNDIVKVLLQLPLFGPIDTTNLHQKLSIFIIKLCCRQYETSTSVKNNHFNYLNCSFIESSSHVAHGMHLLMQILNYTLVHVTTNDINQLSMTSINRLVEKITTEYLSIVRDRGINEILLQLAESDKEIVSFLLNMIEIVLRLEYLLGNTNNSALQLDPNLLQSTYSTLQDCGCDVISLFTYFIADVICYDSSVLLDLLISNETLALKYLLRATAYLENRIKNSSDLAGNCELYKEFHDSLGKMNIVSSRQQTSRDGDILTDSSKSTVVVYEHHEVGGKVLLDARDWIPRTWSSEVVDLKEKIAAPASLDNVINCLEEIAEKLLRFDQVPFQPGKLCARLATISAALSRGKTI